MTEREKPGDIYIEGLRGIAEKMGVSIEEAARIAEQDLYKVGGLEHLSPLQKALEWLKGKGQDPQTGK